MCPLGRKIFSTLAPRSRPEHEHRGAAAWSWCSSVVSYGTSGRHWDLTETFLTPLRLQGFGASASAARLDTRPSARGERVFDRPVTPPHDSVHVIAMKLLLQPDTTKLR